MMAHGEAILQLAYLQNNHPKDHSPDGDNWGDSDNRISRDLVREILQTSELFAYVEVRPHGRASGLGTALSEVEAPHFRALRVADRQGVLDALDALFGDAQG